MGRVFPCPTNPNSMRKPLLHSILAAATVAHCAAAVTYVDATSGAGGNTTLADGSTFSPPLNGTTGVDNNWEQRTTFGSGGNIYESGGEQIENAPELRTRLSGLTPGVQYTIYIHFWDPGSTTEDWNIRAGFTSNPGANTLYSAADATVELGGATAAVLASTLTYTTAPTIFLEGGRNLLAGLVGTATADGSGQIDIYFDDLPNGTTVNRRTWYDGVSFEAVPEPGSCLLSLVGLAALLRRRRR
jgi:hypothetical protein